MSKISSKLRQKENNTDISLYQIYLPKLHENISKYYRLNLFEEIAPGFSHCFEMSSESPANLSDGLFVWIGKCHSYPCLQSIFCVAWTFLVFCSPLPPTHIIIKGIAIGRVRRPNVKGDAIAENFWQPKLGSPACVAWRRVLLPDVGSSNSHSLDPEYHYLLQDTHIYIYIYTSAVTKSLVFINLNLTSDWYSNTLKSSYWNFPMNTEQYSMPLQIFRRN